MKHTFFVTGTDTDVGKSVVTAGLLAKANQQALRTIGLKPIAAGCEKTEEGLRNADALLLQKTASVTLSYDQINPVTIEPAIAPHIGAAMAGKRLTVDRLTGYMRGALANKADLTLIEGAGGWLVPLNPVEQLSGLPVALNTPIILVVGMRLGCLNHALLTVESIIGKGLPLAGWVANCVDADMAAQEDNINTLRAMLRAPCLGVVPFIEGIRPEQAAQYLDVAPLVG